MKTLSDREYALCDEVARTADFRDMDVFSELEERGVLGFVYGASSCQMDQEFPQSPWCGEPSDPVVTECGRLAMLCYRLARGLS